MIQNAILEGFSADSQRVGAGALETASWNLGPVTLGVMPLLTFASAILVILALNQLFYRTALGRAFRTTSVDPVKMQQNMDARVQATPAAAAQRDALHKAIAFQVYEFDCHGIEMNLRYHSNAVVTDSQPEPAFQRDPDLHYQPTTWQGARLPHVWLFTPDGAKVSSLDLCGHGAFTLLTSIGGEPWAEAAKMVGAALGLAINVHVIGPRQGVQDHMGACQRSPR